MYLLEQRMPGRLKERMPGTTTHTFFASIEDARHGISENAIWAIWERRADRWIIADCHPDFLPF